MVIENLSLRKVSSVPVAGFGILQKEVYSYVEAPTKEDLEGSEKENSKPTPPSTEYKNTVRYIAKANGNIYQSESGDNEERKYSELVMPDIHEALVGNNGAAIIMRYLAPESEIIETFIRELPEEVLGADVSTEGKIAGNFLPQQVSDLSMTPDGSSIFYITKTNTGVSGITASAAGANKTQIFESTYSEWLTEWPQKDLVTLTTKPSANVLGYMYGINPNLKDFNKILGGIRGLTTRTSPNGKSVLFADETLKLSVFNRETGESKNLFVNTLPEKCAWGSSSEVVFCGIPQFVPFGSYPDDWYKGQNAFTDNIWQINTLTGETTMLVNPTKLVGESIDVIKPLVSQDGAYLYFINKKNSFLWELRLR